MIDQLDLFAARKKALRGMVHAGGLPTEEAAAIAQLPKLKKLQKRILDQLRERGPLTDQELELLPGFSGFGPSTVRKRRSELYALGLIVADGERTNTRGRRMVVWRAK